MIPDSTINAMKPGPDPVPVAFASLSSTGGIANAYYAVSAAELTKPMVIKESGKQNTKTVKSKN